MSRRLAIRGVGVVGGFGTGREALLRALATGGGPNGTIDVETPEGLKTFPAYLADASGIRSFIDEQKLRRVDRFTQSALLGACLALADAGLLDRVDRTRMGLVLATGHGALGSATELLDSILDDGDAFASPLLFARAIHSAAASVVSILLGIRGPCLTVSQMAMLVPMAFSTARQWLLEGRADQVLVGGVDGYCKVLGYCRERFFGEGNRGPISPLAFDEQTAVAAEGSAFLLLTRDEGVPPRYGYLDKVAVGRVAGPTLGLPEDVLVLVGADGHRHCGSRYVELLPPTAQVAGFAPIYGSLPTGLAFDLVIAALACERGLLWLAPTAKDPVISSQPTVLREEVEIGNRPIYCLKLDKEGWFGWVRLSPVDSKFAVHPDA
jgi:3-oxoacyl-[acyl-carrier-protein] synthase II